MQKYVPAPGRSVPIKCVYQAGKVYEKDGSFLDIPEASPLETKRDERLHSSGKLIGFELDGKRFPITPSADFYDFIYICALAENPELARIVMEYDAFTDIEFHPMDHRSPKNRNQHSTPCRRNAASSMACSTVMLLTNLPARTASTAICRSPVQGTSGQC